MTGFQCGIHVELTLHFLLLKLGAILLGFLNPCHGRSLRLLFLQSPGSGRPTPNQVVVAFLIEQMQSHRRQQGEEIQSVEMKSVLVFHQQVHSNRPQKHRHGHIGPGAPAANDLPVSARAMSRGWIRGAVILGAYLFASALMTKSVSFLVDRQLAGGSASFGYNLLVGLNQESFGGWNQP